MNIIAEQDLDAVPTKRAPKSPFEPKPSTILTVRKSPPIQRPQPRARAPSELVPPTSPQKSNWPSKPRSCLGKIQPDPKQERSDLPELLEDAHHRPGGPVIKELAEGKIRRLHANPESHTPRLPDGSLTECWKGAPTGWRHHRISPDRGGQLKERNIMREIIQAFFKERSLSTTSSTYNDCTRLRKRHLSNGANHQEHPCWN